MREEPRDSGNYTNSTTTTTEIIEGIRYAIAEGADVINMSLVVPHQALVHCCDKRLWML